MISIAKLNFKYARSDFSLQIPNLTIPATEKIAFVGPSGCGKTTLLNLIAGISLPESGSIVTAGKEISKMPDAARRNFRISKIGMVFQQFELIDYLDLKSNILLPFLINRTLQSSKDTEDWAEELASDMGLGDKLKRFPRQLSQGEKQRCAICRALITKPELILADEPTGNLDPKNKFTMMEIMIEQANRHGQTLVIVTHDMSILSDMDRTLDFEKFRRERVAATKDSQ
jgi:putative ABC transport system ATP-binding protein